MRGWLIGIVFVLWAALVAIAFYLAWVQTDTKLQVTLAGCGFVAGAGLLGAAFNALIKGREDQGKNGQETVNRKRGRYERVLELANAYNGHMREAHRHEVDLHLNKQAWQHRDAMTATWRDLAGAIEVARQEAGRRLARVLDALESQLKVHEPWIPPDDVDPLPLERLRAAVEQDLSGRRRSTKAAV